MPVVVALVGTGLVALVAYDVFVTTISATSAGGPVSQPLGLGLWRLLRRGARSPSSPLLAGAGPLVVALTLAVWLLLLWAGWTLIFSAVPGAVVDSATGEAVTALPARIYFAGYALYTLGIGNYVPEGGLWEVLTALATLTGFGLLTMSVSYLVPVAMAVTERRAHAIQLYGLGARAQALVVGAWDGVSFDQLLPQLRQLVPVLAVATQKSLSYPLLHYFHAPGRDAAFEPGVLALDEALLLLDHGVGPEVRPTELTLDSLRSVLDGFARFHAAELTGAADRVPPAPTLEPLRRAGIPTVDDETFRRRVADHAEHRRRMAGYLADAGWPREAAVETGAER